MKKTRITAGILAVLGIGIYLADGSYGVLCILVSAFFVLLCMALYTLAEGRETELGSFFPENGEKNQNINGSIIIKNSSHFPVFRGRCQLNWKNTLTGEEGKEKLSFAAAAGKTTKIPVSVCTEYSGVCQLSVDELEYTDPFVLFRRRENKHTEAKITVFPTIYDIPEKMLDNESFNMESFLYSSERSGEDYGETYQVREYRAGDNMKQVHWKLSARLGEMTVREPGYPVSHAVMVFMETGFDGKFPEPQKMDQQISLALSFLKAFADEGISCQLGFYDFDEERAKVLQAENTDEFWQTAEFAIGAGRSCEGLSGLIKFLESAEEWQAAHYIYVTAGKETDDVEYLRREATVTVFDENTEFPG
nr:DUF58 domain-containing protein [uncultured Blautia sp.]